MNIFIVYAWEICCGSIFSFSFVFVYGDERYSIKQRKIKVKPRTKLNHQKMFQATNSYNICTNK